MKAVLLKSLRVNGVRVAVAKDGPTILDLSEREFTTLEPRGVVRAATRNDLLLAGVAVEAVAPAVVEAPAAPAPKRGRPPKAAAVEATVTETPAVESSEKPDEDL